jgi:hypothetical protein
VATITVEQMRGPVLPISSDDDQGHDPAFHEVAAQRLAADPYFPHTWRHIVFEGAGHYIRRLADDVWA